MCVLWTCGKWVDIDLLCACLYSYSEAASVLQVVEEMEGRLVSVCVCVHVSVCGFDSVLEL